MLTEIHRQAEGNPIIQLATTIREGGTIKKGLYGSSKVIGSEDVDQTELMAADQVLVGMNKTRHGYNARMRELLGRKSKLPVVGDRLVCLKNDSAKELSNGSLWIVHSCDGEEVGKYGEDLIHLTVLSEDFPGAEGVQVKVRTEFFLGGAEQVPWQEKKGTQEFTFGYALTTHKAQGSQWENVYLFDQSSAFRESKDRWLYTAITRASDRITVVQ